MTQAPNSIDPNQDATLMPQSDRAGVNRFGNAEAAYQAARSGVCWFDRSHWGRIWVSDDDRLRFLHNQTTHDFQARQPGDRCETVFVTSTARTLDFVSAYVKAEGVLLLTSPGQAQPLIDWMDRYIFFADKVKLANVTDETVTFTLVGPDAQNCLEQLLGEAIATLNANQHQTVPFDDQDITLSSETGLGLPGYTLIASKEMGESLRQRLSEKGAIAGDETVWEWLRIEQGRPAPGQELTEDYNPLEAGLWQAVSFTKGCYIGQETIARLNTYKGVKQRLFGIESDRPLTANSLITLEGEKIGQVTSSVETPNGWRGLAYIRTKAGGAGLAVQVDGAAATVIDVPFINHQYWQGEAGEAP